MAKWHVVSMLLKKAWQNGTSSATTSDFVSLIIDVFDLNSLGTRETKSLVVADDVPFCHAFFKSIV